LDKCLKIANLAILKLAMLQNSEDFDPNQC